MREIAVAERLERYSVQCNLAVAGCVFSSCADRPCVERRRWNGMKRKEQRGGNESSQQRKGWERCVGKCDRAGNYKVFDTVRIAIVMLVAKKARWREEKCARGRCDGGGHHGGI